MQKQRLEDYNISDIYPNPENYKKNTPAAIDAVKKSIERLGYLKTSITVDENFEILTGHTTYFALKELGYDKVPEIDQISGLSDDEKRAYRIADNKLNTLDEIDFDILDSDLERLEDDLKNITGYEINISSLESDLNYYTNKTKEVNNIKRESEAQPLDLDNTINSKTKNTEVAAEKLNHCPKCGFDF